MTSLLTFKFVYNSTNKGISYTNVKYEKNEVILDVKLR